MALQRGHFMETTPDSASGSAQNNSRAQAQQRICSCAVMANQPTFAAPDQGGSGQKVTMVGGVDVKFWPRVGGRWRAPRPPECQVANSLPSVIATEAHDAKHP